MFKIKTKGFDKLEKSLDNLGKTISSVPKQQSVSLSAILTLSFMSKNTRFSSLKDMEQAFEKKHGKELTAETLSTPEWETFIQENTSFECWSDLVSKAGQEYVGGQVSNIIKNA